MPPHQYPYASPMGDLDWDDEPDEKSCLSPPWLDPDDRLWRHPTEMASSSFAGTPDKGICAPKRCRPWAAVAAAGIVGVSIASAGYAIGAFVGSPVRSAPPKSRALAEAELRAVSTDRTGFVTTAETRKPLTIPVDRSLATVEVADQGSTMFGSAIQFAPGGLYLTASRLTAQGNRSISLRIPQGSIGGIWTPAALVGTDPTTGIAVLRAGSGTGDSEAPLGAETTAGTGTGLYAGERLSLVEASGSGSANFGTTPAFVSSGPVNLNVPDGTVALGSSVLVVPAGSAALGSVAIGADDDVVGIVIYCGGSSGQPGPSTGSGPGVTLLTPIATAQEVALQLSESGQALHGWLGVTTRDVPAGPGSDFGVQVQSVQPASPADDAGILAGDVIESVDGQPVTSDLDLEADVALRAPGSPIVVTLDRAGTVVSVVALLGSIPTDPAGTS